MPSQRRCLMRRSVVAMAVLLGAGPAIAAVAGRRKPGTQDRGRPEDDAGGMGLEGRAGLESVWKFKGEHVSLKTPTRAYEMTIKLNPKGEPEKHIDFDVPEDSPNAKGYKAQGIYKFDQDGTLKICFSDGDSGRPKEFKTDFGKSFSFDLKRKK